MQSDSEFSMIEQYRTALVFIVNSIEFIALFIVGASEYLDLEMLAAVVKSRGLYAEAKNDFIYISFLNGSNSFSPCGDINWEELSK